MPFASQLWGLRVQDIDELRIVHVQCIGPCAHNRSILAVHLLDDPDELSATDQIMVGVVPRGYSCNLRTGKLGQRAEVEPVDNHTAKVDEQQCCGEKESVHSLQCCTKEDEGLSL